MTTNEKRVLRDRRSLKAPNFYLPTEGDIIILSRKRNSVSGDMKSSCSPPAKRRREEEEKSEETSYYESESVIQNIIKINSPFVNLEKLVDSDKQVACSVEENQEPLPPISELLSDFNFNFLLNSLAPLVSVVDAMAYDLNGFMCIDDVTSSVEDSDEKIDHDKNNNEKSVATETRCAFCPKTFDLASVSDHEWREHMLQVCFDADYFGKTELPVLEIADSDFIFSTEKCENSSAELTDSIPILPKSKPAICEIPRIDFPTTSGGGRRNIAYHDLPAYQQPVVIATPASADQRVHGFIYHPIRFPIFYPLPAYPQSRFPASVNSHYQNGAAKIPFYPTSLNLYRHYRNAPPCCFNPFCKGCNFPSFPLDHT